MDIGQKLVLKQSQKLVMTQALQQAIKLLPLTKLELIQNIRQELTENPLLEEQTIQEETVVPKTDDEISIKKEENDKNSKEEVDWETYIQNSIDEKGAIGNYSIAPPIENTLTKKPSLTEHLEWQLSLTAKTDIEKKIGNILIGNINNDGYLKIDIKEIAFTHSFNLTDVEKILKLIQSFDPSGIGARNLQECLLLQIKQRGKEGSLAQTIVKDHLEDIKNQHFEKISKKLDTTIEEIIESIKFIRELAPNPAYRFNTEDTHYIVPDVLIVKIKDEYQIFLNEEGVPRLTINSFYQKMLKTKNNNAAKEYVENKCRSALWLIKSIEQRRNTILKVSRSIIKFQKEFLDKGVDHLKPLVLRDVAEDIKMHESTISRVTTNKYMHTPQGLFEFKYFFHSSLETVYGNSMSSVRIKDMIKHILGNENPKEPIPDLVLVGMLEKKDIKIARRTITKYRKELKIPPAHKRKRIYI